MKIAIHIAKNTRLSIKQSTSPKLAALAMLLSLSGAGTAQAVTVFNEDFEGYTSFPTFDPFFNPINAGIPKISEGASEIWYGARFETPDNGTINSDLAIQKFGGVPFFSSNTTHTGRVEDDAGLLFKLNTTNLDNITLKFDWRTFLASTNDRFVVGYHIGAISNFGTCTGEGESGCFADLTTTLPWYTNQNALNPVIISSNWSPLVRATNSNAWQDEAFLFPDAAENQAEVWVSFWLDNGEGDYALIDNIEVTAVPEADAWVLMVAGLGLVGFMAHRRKYTTVV